MKPILLSINITLLLFCYLIYARAILKKRVKPQRIHHLTLLVITALAVAACFVQGAAIAWVGGISAILSIIAFLLFDNAL